MNVFPPANVIQNPTQQIEDREKVKKRLKQKLKDFSESDMRVFYYLEITLTNNWDKFVNYDDVDLRHFLIMQLLNYPFADARLEQLINIKNYHVVPDFYLKWIHEDVRAALFFGIYLNYQFSYTTIYGRLEYLDFLINTIKTSVIFNENGAIKIYKINTNNPSNQNINIQNLERLKYFYLNHKVKDKSLKWLDEKNEEQIEWAYEYLLEVQEKLILTNMFYPKDIKDKYYLVLASLDALMNSENEKQEVKNGKKTMYLGERDFCIYQMRRAWNSKLFTQKKKEEAEKLTIKVQQNNYKKLERLSQYYEISNNKCINKLIADEYSIIYSEMDNENIDTNI